MGALDQTDRPGESGWDPRVRGGDGKRTPPPPTGNGRYEGRSEWSRKGQGGVYMIRDRVEVRVEGVLGVS